MLPILVAMVATFSHPFDVDAKGGCTPVPPDQCGTKWSDSCLKCGTKSAYDCEECCPHCKLITKGGYSYCTCGAGPSPPPGTDTWANYKVAGMDVTSVTGGKNQSYNKVVIMLHGGGASGQEFVYNYDSGWFHNLTGLKYVFPTSAFPSHVWYKSFKKQGCGLANDCAYDLGSIDESATRVAALIEHERGLVGGSASNVYLAGFSEGAQLTGYMQLKKLTYALGGTIIMDGFPLPPLFDWTPANHNASYSGPDMKWMIYWGGADPIFPATTSLKAWHTVFDAIGASSVIKIEHTEPGMTHTLTAKEFVQMESFVRGDTTELVESRA